MNESKLIESKKLIESVVFLYKKPVIFCSFGKDSVVLLHLIRSLGHKLPVVFYREPFSPKKYEYADKIIRDWDLTVYDYPPFAVGFFTKNGIAHTINYQNLLGLKNMARMTGLVAPKDGEDYLCALEDLIERPLANYLFPWDVSFHGHKGSDIDPVTGPIPLKVDLLNVPGSTDMAYPLRHWSDSDVWEYIEENKIPINEGRYEKIEGQWGDVKDKALNSDYFSACWKCVDRSEASTVWCPKKKAEIPNVGMKIHYDELKLEYMGN
jgi:hypothetical protein